MVLCPVCKARRLLQSSGTVFCGCGGFRLSREDGASASSGGGGGGGIGGVEGGGSFTLDHLRRRLEEVLDGHQSGGCEAQDLSFSVQSKFGIDALYAECASCHFLEAVM